MKLYGDTRLDERYKEFESSMSNRCSVKIRQIASNRNEEISYGRLLRNKKVSASKILSNGYERCNIACQDRHVLLIQDTSAMGFGLNPLAGMMGPIANNMNRGFYLHPTLCLDAVSGACLGVSDAQILQREDGAKQEELSLVQRKKVRRITGFEDKESYRWWSSVQRSTKQVSSAKRYTVIADSEADIYDLMHNCIESDLDFVIRNFHDRTLNSGRSKFKISDQLSDQAVQATYQIKLPATDKRSAHLAHLEVKWTTINIARPHDTPSKHLAKVLKTNLIEIKETAQSVVGNEKPIYWRLLSSHSIENFEQVLQIIKWYIWRWTIEQLFRTIKKKGLDIQSAEVETEHGLKNLTATALLSAVQIMQLVQARQGHNDLLITQVFNQTEHELMKKLNPKLEGRTEKLKNPHAEDSLAYASWIIARLGGWSGYKSQRPAGPITTANGLRRFKDMCLTHHLLSG